MLHTDIPTERELRDLASHRSSHCVSIYLPTGPHPVDVERSRIALSTMLAAAVEQLEAGGADRDDIEAMRDAVTALVDDDYFWSYQSHSLAIFAAPDGLRTYRVPNRLTATVQVSDRFHLKPLLRTLTVPQGAFVLALSQNAVRLIEISADAPAVEVAIEGMPADASWILATRGDRGSASIAGDQWETPLLGNYARQIDRALRSTLVAARLPLIIAAAEPLASIYRSVCRYSGLVSESIVGNPDLLSADELAAIARPILDRLAADDIAALAARVTEAIGTGRGSADLSDLARAATYGAIDTLMIDIDRAISGTLDEQSGALALSEHDDAVDYGVVDEIARRALLSGAHVVAVRSAEMPGGAAAAGILRFPS